MKAAKTAIAALGVDRGGTWTRVTAADRRGRALRAARFRTSPLRSLPARLGALLARWPGASGAPLVIATRGAIGKPWKKPFLFKALAGRLNLVEVISDAEAAHLAAFGGRPGLLLIAGTGSVAFSGRPGAFRRTGGLNPVSGDPGSGRWLGRQYLKLKGRLCEAGRLGHGGQAACARRLLALARRDSRAAALVARAHADLASLLRRAAAGGRGPVTAALAGGLLADGDFRRGFEKAARLALAPRKLRTLRAAAPAELAAARLALLPGRTS